MEEEKEVIETDTPATLLTARQRADQLIHHLNSNRAINELFSDAFERQYLIYGKPPKEWRAYFKVHIPEDPDTGQCKSIAAKLASLTQEVNFYFAAAEAQVDALLSGEEKEFTTNFNRLCTEFKAAKKTLPAHKTMESIARGGMMDVAGAVQNAKIIKNFWKRIGEGLMEVRKNLEIATWNNSTQKKYELYGGGGNVPKTPNRGEFGSDAQYGGQLDSMEDDKLENKGSDSDEWD